MDRKKQRRIPTPKIPPNPEQKKRDDLAYLDYNIDYWTKRLKSDPIAAVMIEGHQRTRERYHDERLVLSE